MVLTWVWAIFALCATGFAIFNENAANVSAAAIDGAKNAINLRNNFTNFFKKQNLAFSVCICYIGKTPIINIKSSFAAAA